MNTSILALRAITGTLFRRLFIPISWIIVGILVIVFVGVIFLGIAVHPLWFLACIILIPLTIVLAAVGAALWYLSEKILPRRMSKHERQLITTFADRVIRIAEVRATPLPILAAMIAKDVMRGKGSGYVEGIITDSKELTSDFRKMREMFAPKQLS